MADDDEGMNGSPEQPQPEDDLVRMLITFNTHTGIVNVNGPIDNKILSYGLLEVAKDVVRRHKANRIVQPGIMLPEFRQ